MKITKNPIFSGFYPDPSVCGVEKRDKEGKITGADYYLVNSSFAYVPGVPIFHSENLQDWVQLGHVLDREEQLALKGAGISEGIYAPTIRYHDGTYYMITTNVSDKGNFYVTANAPCGPWSEPIWLEDAEGIDPSLFFEDNTCYYVGQRTKKDAKYFGDCEIWLQELDLKQGKLVGEVSVLWDGSMKHAVWPEGPHLYKRGDYYYLVIAEGGTAYSHSICVARSKEIRGPYEGCPNNPIFTHRHLGRDAEIQNVGHADFVETPEGEWYAVMLATRPIEGYAPLGRETFLAKVAWEEEWPLINPGVGMLSEVPETEKRESVISWADPFDMRCLFYGYPQKEMYRIENGNVLALQTSGTDFGKMQSPNYVGVRVTKKCFSLKTSMHYCPEEEEEAGLVYLYDEKNYVKLIVRLGKDGKAELQVKKAENGVEQIVAAISGVAETCTPELSLSGLVLSCKADGKVMAEVDVRKLTSEATGGFVGCTMGVYAGGNKKAGNYARFSELIING